MSQTYVIPPHGQNFKENILESHFDFDIDL